MNAKQLEKHLIANGYKLMDRGTRIAANGKTVRTFEWFAPDWMSISSGKFAESTWAAYGHFKNGMQTRRQIMTEINKELNLQPLHTYDVISFEPEHIVRHSEYWEWNADHMKDVIQHNIWAAQKEMQGQS